MKPDIAGLRRRLEAGLLGERWEIVALIDALEAAELAYEGAAEAHRLVSKLYLDTKEEAAALRAALEEAHTVLLNAPSLVEGEMAYIRWFDNKRLPAFEKARAVLATDAGKKP